MPFRAQTYYPDAAMFMDTNHVSDDLEGLKRFVAGDSFRGFRVRIVDDAGAEVFSPPVHERAGDPTIDDIAGLLGVPVIDFPVAFSDDESDERA